MLWWAPVSVDLIVTELTRHLEGAMSRRYCPLARTLLLLGSVTILGVITMSPAMSQTTQFPGGFLERDDAAHREPRAADDIRLDSAPARAAG